VLETAFVALAGFGKQRWFVSGSSRCRGIAAHVLRGGLKQVDPLGRAVSGVLAATRAIVRSSLGGLEACELRLG
jgi:hypothetical protein